MKYLQHTYSCCGKFKSWSWETEKIKCPKCGKLAKVVPADKPQLHAIRTPTKNR